MYYETTCPLHYAKHSFPTVNDKHTHPVTFWNNTAEISGADIYDNLPSSVETGKIRKQIHVKRHTHTVNEQKRATCVNGLTPPQIAIKSEVKFSACAKCVSNFSSRDSNTHSLTSSSTMIII